MTRVISVVSGKGGVGKTCIALNLGLALTLHEKRVLLIDADIGMPSLGTYAGVEDRTPTLYDILTKDKKISSTAAVHRFQIKNTTVDIIPCGQSLRDFLQADLSHLQRILDEMAPKYDYIIMDTAPGLSKHSLTPPRFSDLSLIVTTPNYASVSSAERLSLALKVLKPDIRMSIIVNMYKKEKGMPTPEGIQSKLGAEVLAVVPEDGEMDKAIVKRVPLLVHKPKSKAAKSILQAARSIMAKDGAIPAKVDLKKIGEKDISKDLQIKKVF